MNLTAEQLDTLSHMLGINDPMKRRPEPYRNYYAANPGDPKLVELERLGAVRLARKASGPYSDDCYVCTEDGRAAAMSSHRTIRAKKSARVYHCYLGVSDCFPDLTFREFLTSPEFAQTRRDA